MKQQPYDLIGDIHGHHDKLICLLRHLGYQQHFGSHSHPEGRKVIFLGDYIDRGPKVRDTLTTVRAMVDSGDALAIMGNHEYNAIGLHTPNGKGGWLREHRPDRDNGHKATLASFAGHPGEWAGWLAWMKRLPLFLDLGGLRAVENVLKGPEMAIPEGIAISDKEGVKHTTLRTRWWNIPAAAKIGEIAMPEPYPGTGDADTHALRRLPNYDPSDKPVFFGHYWLPAHQTKAPLAKNVACLDYSAARGDNPLVAYRWDGEQELSATKFIS